MLNNEVLGVPIKFKPVVGNLHHIKIVEKLGDLGDKRVRYGRAVEEGKKAEKLLQEIQQLESHVRWMIEDANGDNL